MILPPIINKPVINFWVGRTLPIKYVTIHSTASGKLIPWEDEENGTINWWNNLASLTSAHILIPRTTNEVWRCVHDENRSWTVEGLNHVSLNLEFAHRLPGVNDPEEFVTQNQLIRGAYIVKTWCDKYNIPKKRILNIEEPGIIGHADIPPEYNSNRHWDPGKFFQWEKFINYIND